MAPEGVYHLYNRANGNEKLFLSDDNYRYFLRGYQNYIAPIATTYCYCLMPNHFHFLIALKSEEELEAFFIQKAKNHLKSKTLSGLQDLKGLERLDYLSKKVSFQFSHFFNSYSQAFNKQQNRRGSLFMKPFKRIPVTDQRYLLQLVRYIHQNPVEANLCSNCHEWPYSSYKSLIDGNSSFIDANTVINWFDDVENFIYCHRNSNHIEFNW